MLNDEQCILDPHANTSLTSLFPRLPLGVVTVDGLSVFQHKRKRKKQLANERESEARGVGVGSASDVRKYSLVIGHQLLCRSR